MPVGERVDPYKNFRFRVEIDGITHAGFTEVVMPEASAEVIEYREGVHESASRKLLGRINYGNITLKWGSTASRELYGWWKSTVEGHLQRKNMFIILVDDEGNDAKRWKIRDAWPVCYKPSALEAKGNDVFIEMIEIAHEGMELD